jgi:hypothetical protein
MPRLWPRLLLLRSKGPSRMVGCMQCLDNKVSWLLVLSDGLHQDQSTPWFVGTVPRGKGLTTSTHGTNRVRNAHGFGRTG